MKLFPLLCLLTQGFGPTSAQNRPGVVTVSEGADALLPCVLDSGHNIDKFDWKKDNGKEEKLEVLFYENGEQGVYQSEQFRGRVKIFKDELKSGNASIQIKNTSLEDNGTYTCVLFKGNKPIQIIKLRLNVGVELKKRHIPGAATAPCVKHIRVEENWWLLQCKVPFAVPKPELEWKDSTGKVLSSSLSTEDKHVTSSQDPSGRFNFELLVNVTKSDLYTCVVTQRNIYHQINNTLEVRLQGAALKPYIQTLEDEMTWSLLECQANGVPEPEMTWENSAGEVLAKHVPKNNAQVKLQLNVTRSDTYKCVVTQRDIHHQINNTEKVRISEHSTGSVGNVAVITVVVTAAILLVVFGIIIAKRCAKIRSMKDLSSRPVEAKPLNDITSCRLG